MSETTHPMTEPLSPRLSRDEALETALGVAFNVETDPDTRDFQLFLAELQAQGFLLARIGEAEALRRQVVAVNDIHFESQWPSGICWIDHQPWPCKTRKAMDAALAAPAAEVHDGAICTDCDKPATNNRPGQGWDMPHCDDHANCPYDHK